MDRVLTLVLVLQPSYENHSKKYGIKKFLGSTAQNKTWQYYFQNLNQPDYECPGNTSGHLIKQRSFFLDFLAQVRTPGVLTILLPWFDLLFEWP